MGAIRGILLVFVCVLFFASFLLMGIFATLNSSLKYENVKSSLKPAINGTIYKQMDLSFLEKKQSTYNDYCNNTNNSSSTNYSFYDKETNRTISISCEMLLEEDSVIIDYWIDSFIKEEYYKERTCEFWKCFGEETIPFFLVSQHAKDYWKTKYYLFLIVSVVLAFLLFLLVENKTNFPILLGILIGISVLPVSVLDNIGSSALELVFSFLEYSTDALALIDLNLIISVFFSKANFVFLTGFILGIVLIALGVLMKIFKIGLKIEEKLSKKEGSEKAAEKTAVKEEKPVKEIPEKTKSKKISRDKKGEIF